MRPTLHFGNVLHSSIYMTVKWVLGELECAPEGLAKILVDGMPGKTLEIV